MKIVVVPSPRPDDELHWWERNPPTEFVECETCRAKPGSPILCHGCLSNRALIFNLKKELGGR